MKIYIFGAGASLGSQNNAFPTDHQSRSPLINELFDPRYSWLANYSLTLDRLDEIGKSVQMRDDKSVEKWLEEKWNLIDQLKPFQKRQSSRRLFGHILFYLWNVMRVVSASYNKDNGYRKFLEKIESKGDDFGLISFNYDTLLDKAYQEVFNKSLISIQDYLDDNFIKPHGSINWILTKRISDPPAPRASDTRLRLSMGMEHFFGDRPIPIDNLEVLDPFLEALREDNIAVSFERLNHEYFYPLIFMPLAQKNLSQIDRFYDRIISKAEMLMKEASEIYVIGYRAQDMIIKDLFKYAQKGTQLHVISDKSASTLSGEIRGWANNLSKGSEINGGFNAFINTHFS